MRLIILLQGCITLTPNISWLNIYENFEYEFKLSNMSTENQNTSE